MSAPPTVAGTSLATEWRPPLPKRAWLVVAVLAATAALNYFDRSIVAVLKPALKDEFVLTDWHYSWLVTAFMAPYIIMYIWAGRFVDRHGSRVMLAVFLIGWSLATFANGLVTGLTGLVACRFMLGVMEPGGFNACQRAIMDWFPPEKRGLAMSLLSPGTALGSIAAAPVLAYLTMSFGWRWGFLVPGIAGLLLAVVWWKVSDRSSIESASAAAETRPLPVPLRQLLASRALWGLMLARIVSDPVWYFYQFWLPGYFQEKLGLDLGEYGRIGWIPSTIALIVCLGLGLWTDRRVARRGQSLFVRRNTVIGISALAPISICTTFVDSIWLAVAIVTVTISIGQSWLFFVSLLQTELFPPNAVGTANGLIGACGAAFGLLLNVALGWIVPAIGYRPIFVLSGLLYPVAALLVWRLVREPMKAHP